MPYIRSMLPTFQVGKVHSSQRYGAFVLCRRYLKSLDVVQSSSRAHVPYDNSVMKAFFKSFKAEELYRRKYRSENEFKTAIDSYMVFYNERRPYAKNGYKTPYKKEELFFSSQAT